jgi:hypothetical protein
MWTNVFASVCICSSQDAKVTWTKALRKQHLKRRHYEDHKWRSTSIKQSPRHEESVATRGLSGTVLGDTEESHRTIQWDTRLSSARLTRGNDHLQWSIQRLVEHWTIRCLPPNYSMCHREATTFLERLVSSWDLFILHPTSHLKAWEPKQHTNICYRHFQVLIHLSA